MAHCPPHLRLVLDTNVVLDWLVFNDPALDLLRARIRDKDVTVVTHAAAVDELTHVLAYDSLDLDAFTQAKIRDTYRLATSLESGASRTPLPEGFPRCRDHDDDHFVALAYRAKADALVSRDKAVLKLKRRAARFGLRIVDVREMIAMLSTGRDANG